MSFSDYGLQMSDVEKQVASEPPWYKYICEYYGVTPDEALQLGTRASGRKPSLPGSKTCKPVSGMTFEDIWDIKPRDTLKSLWEFYIDQGAWSAFRQTVRHLDLQDMRKDVMSRIIHNGDHLVEYGCGIAPFASTLLQSITPSNNMDISLTDVEGCEHLIYGHWVLNKIKEERSLSGVNIHEKPATLLDDITCDLPKYEKNIDVFIIFEVLEHLPSPVAVINSAIEQMNPNARLVENFIKHENKHQALGPDLESASSEREEFYNIVNANFNLAVGRPEPTGPSETRIWVKK